MRQVGVVSLQMAHLTENELPRLKTKVKALSEEVQELKTDISQARYVIELCLFIITGDRHVQNDSELRGDSGLSTCLFLLKVEKLKGLVVVSCVKSKFVFVAEYTII